MCKIGKIIGCCLIAVSLLAFTACSGLDRLSENLKDGAEQLSNALITPLPVIVCKDLPDEVNTGAELRIMIFFGPPMTLL